LPVLFRAAPGELEILGDAFIGAGRDKSNARCCRPYRQLHPAVARGGDMFESNPKEIIYSSRSHCGFESKYAKFPVRISTAPTLKRISPALIRSKSTSCPSVACNGVLS